MTFISPPTQSLGQTFTVRLAISFVFLVPTVILVMVTLGEKPLNTVPLAIAGGLVVLCGVLWVVIGKTVLSIHPEGLRRTTAFGETELPWEEIRETRFQAIPVQAGGLIGFAALATVRHFGGKGATTSLKLQVIGNDGRRLNVTSNYRHASDAIGFIMGRIQPKMLADAKRSVENGETVFYGPLSVSRAGVAWKRKDPVPFGELSKAAIQGRYLRLKRKGKFLDICRVRTDKVPNVLVFLDLIESLGAGAGETASIDPLARVQ